MADKKEEESKIPVFTVIKNGAILKNIFLINNPPSPPSDENEETSDEEILIVGRHPDCHVMLTHPSISRFHLQIQSNPSSLKLSVIDLSSVHGTWVSEKKIEPGVPVEMNEDDTLKIGGSTRVYRLHWVPFSQAYDMNNPFVSPMDLEEIENQDIEERNEMGSQQDSLLIETKQIDGQGSMMEGEKDEISAPIQDKSIHSLDFILDGIFSLFSDENSELIPKREIPSSGIESVDLSLPVGDNFSVYEVQLLGTESQIPWHDSVTDNISEIENPDGLLRTSEENSNVAVDLFASPSDAKEGKILEKENQRPLQKENELKDTLKVCSLELQEIPSEIISEQLSNENQTLQSLAVLQPLSEIGNKENSSVDQDLKLVVNQKSTFFYEHCHPAALVYDEAENRSLSRRDHRPKEIPSFESGVLEAESVNSSLPSGEAFSEITDNKKCQNPQSLFAPGISSLEKSESSPVRSDKRAASNSIWSRRGKPASVLQIQTSRSRGKTKGDCKNADVDLAKLDDIENRSISKILFSGSESQMEEQMFTPEKENLTPNTLLLKSLQRKGKQEEIKQSKSCRKSSSKVIFSPNIQPEEDLTLTSDKENRTPKVLLEQKLVRGAYSNQVKLEQERVLMKARAAERVPFQPLVNFPGKRRSEASLSEATTRSSNSVSFSQTTEITNSSSLGEGRRGWTMIVDTSTFLDKESRKSLQLLQGLKRTQLIIPRMVIRELDCLKRRGNLFGRKSQVSSSLEWIEECMVKTKWWIHIQSSVEEGRPIAPTPPASPQSQFSIGSGHFHCGTPNWGPFSSRTSLTEIVSPTSEDHIMDYALLFRKMKNDRRLVLLSNDVTMKIKAMAEGLNCETAQEFRESLVNPFSERFLWADSSPRGRTWSYLDDVVLREKYNHGPLKKPSKGGDGANGLKLILPHNSHYAWISSVR